MTDPDIEKQEPESFATTLDFDEWSRLRSVNQLQYSELDIAGAKILRPYFKGFMTQPTALYKGKTLVAASRAAFDFAELKKELSQIEGEKFLYSLDWMYSRPSYFAPNNQGEEYQQLDTPIFSQPFWRIRYGILGKGIEVFK